MSTREQAIDAGVRRLKEAFVSGNWSDFTDGDLRYLSISVIEAVEPILVPKKRVFLWHSPRLGSK